MLTASHNPPQYHGFKLKGPYGGTATPDIYKGVSEKVRNLESKDIKSFDSHRHSIESFDIRYAYYDFLKPQVNL